LPKEMDLNSDYSAPKNGKSELTIEGNDVVILPVNSTISPWEFDLNSDIPINLDAEVGIGEMRINLTDTNVTDFNSEMGIGLTVLTLPEDGDIEAHVSGAIGQLVIRVPENAEVVIKTDNAIVNTDMPSGYTRSGDTIRSPKADPDANQIDLNVDLAIGSLIIQEYK